MRSARVKAYRSGVLAEAIVATLLRLKGHRIVAQRYKTPVGEIDLVALKGKRLAFIEVKRRKTREDAAWTLPTTAAAADRARRAILACRPPRLCRPRHRLRRGADRALGLAALSRQRISGLTMTPFGASFAAPRGASWFETQASPAPHHEENVLTLRRAKARLEG